MKVGQNYFPKSSFLSVDKDFSLITQKLLSNQRLCKMLYYTQQDCLKAPDLTEEQKVSLIGKQIKIVPKVGIEEDCPNYIIILMDNFVTNDANPQFRDCTITFNILCHPDHWNLGNFQLRPYKIAGEIDAMLNEKKLTGIGELIFSGANEMLLNDQLMGVALTYAAIHGVEDQVNPLV